MNNDFFEKGLEKRKATLGKEYVEKNLGELIKSQDLSKFIL